MKCLFCTTELPVDGNTKTVTCPKCGGEMAIRILNNVSGVQLLLVPVEHPSYGENERYENLENN